MKSVKYVYDVSAHSTPSVMHFFSALHATEGSWFWNRFIYRGSDSNGTETNDLCLMLLFNTHGFNRILISLLDIFQRQMLVNLQTLFAFVSRNQLNLTVRESF